MISVNLPQELINYSEMIVKSIDDVPKKLLTLDMNTLKRYASVIEISRLEETSKTDFLEWLFTKSTQEEQMKYADLISKVLPYREEGDEIIEDLLLQKLIWNISTLCNIATIVYNLKKKNSEEFEKLYQHGLNYCRKNLEEVIKNSITLNCPE